MGWAGMNRLGWHGQGDFLCGLGDFGLAQVRFRMDRGTFSPGTWCTVVKVPWTGGLSLGLGGKKIHFGWGQVFWTT